MVSFRTWIGQNNGKSLPKGWYFLLAIEGEQPVAFGPYISRDVATSHMNKFLEMSSARRITHDPHPAVQ